MGKNRNSSWMANCQYLIINKNDFFVLSHYSLFRKSRVAGSLHCNQMNMWSYENSTKWKVRRLIAHKIIHYVYTISWSCEFCPQSLRNEETRKIHSINSLETIGHFSAYWFPAYIRFTASYSKQCSKQRVKQMLAANRRNFCSIFLPVSERSTLW